MHFVLLLSFRLCECLRIDFMRLILRFGYCTFAPPSSSSVSISTCSCSFVWEYQFASACISARLCFEVMLSKNMPFISDSILMLRRLLLPVWKIIRPCLLLGLFCARVHTCCLLVSRFSKWRNRPIIWGMFASRRYNRGYARSILTPSRESSRLVRTDRGR